MTLASPTSQHNERMENQTCKYDDSLLQKKGNATSTSSMIDTHDSCGTTEDDQTLTSNDDVSEAPTSSSEDEEEDAYGTQRDDSIATTIEGALEIAYGRCRKLEDIGVSSSEEVAMVYAHTREQVHTLLLHLAAMHRDRCEYERSVEYFKRAINMIESDFETTKISYNIDVGRILVNIGRVRMRQKQLELALECFMKAVDIFQAALDANDEKGSICSLTRRHYDLTLRLCKRVSWDLSNAMRRKFNQQQN